MKRQLQCPICGGVLLNTQRIQPGEGWRYREGADFKSMGADAVVARLCQDCGMVQFFVKRDIRSVITSYERAEQGLDAERDTHTEVTPDPVVPKEEEASYTAGLEVEQRLDFMIVTLPDAMTRRYFHAELGLLYLSLPLLGIPFLLYVFFFRSIKRRRLLIGTHQIQLQELQTPGWRDLNSVSIDTVLSVERQLAPGHVQSGMNEPVFDLRLQLVSPHGERVRVMEGVWLRQHEIDWLEQTIRRRLHQERAVQDEDELIPSALQALRGQSKTRP